MRIWIDATDSRSLLEVFGMTLIERQLRTIAAAGIKPTEVVIELPPDSSSAILPADLTSRFNLRWLRESGPLHRRLGRVLRETQGEPLLALEADSIIDARLLQHLAGQTALRVLCAPCASVNLPFSDKVRKESSPCTIRA